MSEEEKTQSEKDQSRVDRRKPVLPDLPDPPTDAPPPDPATQPIPPGETKKGN